MLTGILVGASGLIVVIIIWAISVYNRLIQRRTVMEEGWSGIDVQLKRRHDLVGNLVNTVKGFMQHERAVLEEVTKQRAMSQQAQSQGPAAASIAESGLSQSLGKLFAVMENYPAVKASANAMHLQEELTSLEAEIQLARRYYNATARDLNILVQSFPSSIVAKRFKFALAEFFEVDNIMERQAPQVSFE